MGDNNDTFAIFNAKVIESFKGKGKGSIKLTKGASVMVLGTSQAGDKYFGEVGKQRGWFPKECVVKTGTPVTFNTTLTSSGSTNLNNQDSPNKIKRVRTLAILLFRDDELVSLLPLFFFSTAYIKIRTRK